MWLDQPPQTKENEQIPLLRATSKRPVGGRLTGDPLRCFVHFAAGHSWPCTGFGCTLCGKKISKRFYAYYQTIGTAGGVAILELTGLAEASLISQMEPFSHVPCGQVRITRPPGKRNMPCVVQWSEPTNNKNRGRGTNENENDRSAGTPTTQKEKGCQPMTQEEMKLALFRIWKLPLPNGHQEEKEWLAEVNEAIRLKTSKTTT